MTPEAYADRLLTPPPLRPDPPPLPDLDAATWFKPERAVPEKSFRDLFVSGVLCGHVETRDYLAARISEYDVQRQQISSQNALLQQELLAAHRDSSDARRHHEADTRHLRQQVEAARARVREFERSTFWRATYPARVLAHGLRIALRRGRAAMRRARLVAPRLATARQIARDQGLAELMRRLRAKIKVRAPRAALRARQGLATAIEPLRIAASDAPRVSVIIPTYGQELHTYTCLKALADEALRVPLEIIVMDDCAPQSTADALDCVTGVRFERNETNLGFVRNCNRGASLAKGDFLLFLNNDAVVAPGTMEALLAVFDARADAGAVGAKLVYPDGRLQEAGAIVWRDGSAWNYGRGDDPDRPEYNYVRQVDYCSAACLLIPSGLFRSLGGFDERYVPAYCEDTDLCFKVREAGKAVYYQPAAEVVHFEGVSHGVDETQGVKRYQVENRRKLHARWHGALAEHRGNGSLPHLERDRAARRRVLFVEACMLTPDQDAGSVRTWRLIEIMSDMGCKITFAAENLENAQPYAGRLQQMGVEVLFSPYVTSIERLIEERGRDFDIVILARYYVAARYIDAVRRHAPDALLVLDTIDLHYLRQRRLAALEGGRALAQSAQAIYLQEIECVRKSDVTWVVSDVERDILATEVPSARVIVQSMIHVAEPPRRRFSEREGILFVGGYRHPPNVDAAYFYVREIAPIVRELLPGVTTYLIGSNPPQSLTDLAGEGVEVLGFVPDLDPWLERIRVSISPLRYGAGVKGKVNQAMSCGIPVVATTASIEGIRAVAGEEILVADDPRAFAEAVASVYRDEALWNRLSAGGLANVSRQFSPQVAERALSQLFEMARQRRAA